MRRLDFQIGFLNEINRSKLISNKPTTFEIEYWINAGIRKFIKTRYSGLNIKQEAFEESEKRIEDLRNLVKEKVISITEENIKDADTPYQTIVLDNIFNIDSAVWFVVNETVDITSNSKCWPTVKKGTGEVPAIKTVDVVQCTNDNINSRLNNSLSEYHFHNNYARPLRLFQGKGVYLYTDGNYTLKNYSIRYIKEPEPINITAMPMVEYTDLAAHTHDEIIRLAAKMYIENQAEPRYRTYSNEVNEGE